MKRVVWCIVFGLLLLSSGDGVWSPAQAAILTVGSSGAYPTPCAAIAAASPGDVIAIAAEEYVDDTCVITTGELTLRGVGPGRPHLRATKLIGNQKGIWVIAQGVGPIVVENVEFSGARVQDQNGAGIRMQGQRLEVRGCYFHDNENGILSGGTSGHEVVVEGSELAHNGRAGSGQEHNIYISSCCASFTFRGNYTHHAKSGHTIKSRCDENLILYNRIMDEDDGFSSYLIDLPQGGRSILLGNLIQQGPNAENTGTLVSYKCESPTNDVLSLHVAHNTLVNDHAKTTVNFIRACQADTVQVVNNLFVGAGTPIAYDGALTEAGNLQTDAPGLVDRAGYDYRLTAASPAVDQGVDPGVADGLSLTPLQHYVHPARLASRVAGGPLDVGAYELVPPGSDARPAEDGGRLDDGGAPADAAPNEGGAAATDGAAGKDGISGSMEAGPSYREPAADGGCGCKVGQEEGGWGWGLLFLVFLLGLNAAGARGVKTAHPTAPNLPPTPSAPAWSTAHFGCDPPSSSPSRYR